MAKEESAFAVLFADVESSSKLYKTVGDVEAKQRIDLCIGAMREEIETNLGIVIKTIGDEIMARFDDACHAAKAAIAIQRRLELGEKSASGSVSVKVGFHFGPAILDDGDVFGDAVNDAAYMVKIAKGRQIITTESTITMLDDELREQANLFDSVKVKAGKKESNIFLLNWDNDGINTNATMVSTGIGSSIAPQGEKMMFIKYGDKRIPIVSDITSFILGRDDTQCDLVINSRFASRKHVWIVFRRGKFVLVDHSTNGTWVKTEDDKSVYIRREELPLWGSGEISLGEGFEANLDNRIQFFC